MTSLVQEHPVFYALFLLCLQHGKEGRLWQLHVTHHLHALLSFLLLFQKLALAGDVAAVALGQHVLTQGLYGSAEVGRRLKAIDN